MTIKKLLNLLLSPWAILAGMISGVLIGVQYKELAFHLAPLGEMYLALLQMCIIPIMITAITSSLGHLLISGRAMSSLCQVLMVFILGLILASAIGISIGIVAKPGTEINAKARIILGKRIFETEAVSFEQAKPEKVALLEFFKKIFTPNVIQAISQSKNLPILIFFILLGIAIGIVRSQGSETLLEIINVLYDALLRMMMWFMYGLPFGLCFLLAAQVASVGLDIMMALLKLIISCYIGAFILIGVYSVAIWIKIRGSFFESFVALKGVFVVALGTSSSFASIPAALNGLQNNLHLDKQSTNLAVPLGINLNPHGSVMHFAISTVFIAQLYGVPLELPSLVIILIASILAGLAATGAPGPGALSMIALILEPLGLPVVTAVILLAAIDPIVDPIVTLTTVYANCATSTIIAKKQ